MTTLARQSKFRDTKMYSLNVKALKGQLASYTILTLCIFMPVVLLFPVSADCQQYYQRQIEELTWHINNNPDDIDAYIERGLAYYDSGQYDLAIRDFSRVLSINAYNPDALYYRGLTYGKIQQYSKAIYDFETLLTADPFSADAYRMLGFVHFQIQEYEQAVEDYNSGLDLDPADDLIYLYRGDALYALQDYRAALKDYNQALQLAPDNAGTYCARANAHFNLKDYESVVRDCNSAIGLDYSHAYAYLLRGNANYELGELERARDDFAMSLKFDPSLQAARDWLEFTEKTLNTNIELTGPDSDSDYDFDSFDTTAWFEDWDLPPSANYSESQIEVINRLGQPESFTLMMVALDEDSEEIVRNEIWNYFSLGSRFIFLRGELILTEDIDSIDEESVLPGYTPDQFRAGMSFAEVLEVTGEREFVLMEVIDEYIESGDLYYTEQLVLGFKDDQLFFVESQPLIPVEE